MISVLYLTLIVVGERCGSVRLNCCPCLVDMTVLIVLCCGEGGPGIPGWIACPVSYSPSLASVHASSLGLKVSMMGYGF
jgi:hypothetical protein